MTRQFSFDDHSARFAATDTARDLEQALDELLQQVGADLGADDLRDDAFVDFAADQMTGAGVPRALVDEAKRWMRRGGRRGDLADVRRRGAGPASRPPRCK